MGGIAELFLIKSETTCPFLIPVRNFVEIGIKFSKRNLKI